MKIYRQLAECGSGTRSPPHALAALPKALRTGFEGGGGVRLKPPHLALLLPVEVEKLAVQLYARAHDGAAPRSAEEAS